MKQGDRHARLGKLGPRSGALAAALMTLAGLLFLALLLGRSFENHLLQSKRDETATVVARYANTLGRSINHGLSQVESLKVLIESNLEEHGVNSFQPKEYQKMAHSLFISHFGIQYIAIAPAGILKFIYPLQGNQSLLNKNLMHSTGESPDANIRQAIETRRMAIDGPFVAENGTHRFVAYQALLHGDTFWGVVCIAYSLEQLFEETQITQISSDVDLVVSLPGNDVIYGHPAVLQTEPVIEWISMNGPHLEVAAIPANGGWNKAIEPQMRLYWAAALPFCVILAMLIYLSVNRQASLSISVKERTRELETANERLQAEIRQHQQTEQALRFSQEKLHTTLLSIGDAVITTDPEGNVTLLNPVAEHMTGLKMKDAIGMPVSQVLRITAEATGATVPSPVMEVLASGIAQKHGGEYLLHGCNDESHMVEHGCFPIRDEDGSIRGSVSVLRDIGEEVQAQRALSESERSQRMLMSNLPGMVYRCLNDENWTMLIVSEGTQELTGYPAEDLIGNRKLKFLDIMHEDDVQFVRDAVAAGLSARKPYQANYRIIRADGEERWVWEKGQGVWDDNGNLLFLEGFLSDITDLKRAEESLQRSRDFYLRLLDEFPNPIWRADANGEWNYFNKGWLNFTGRTSEEESGRGWIQGIHPDDRAAFEDAFEKAVRAHRPFVMEYRLAHRNKEHRWVANYCRPFSDVDGSFSGFIGCCFDIQDRRHADEALAREAIVNAAIADLSSELHLLDSVEEISRSVLSHTSRLSDSELTVVGYTDPASPELLCPLSNPAPAYAAPIISPEAIEAIWKWVLHSRQPLVTNNVREDERMDFDGLQNGSVNNLLCMPCLSGDDVVGLILTANTPMGVDEAMLDAAWRVSTLFTLAVQRRRAEEVQARVQEHLQQAHKLEAIGQLAGGVAHDFNNLLVGILGYANLLKMEAEAGSMNYEAARTIEKAAERAAALTQQLLGFARRGKHQNVQIDLNNLMQEALRLLTRTVEKNIRFVCNLSDDRPIVMGDPTQLQQVLLNLAVNARDAMPDGGDLFIESRKANLTEEFCRTHPECTPGKHVEIVIRDTGSGMTHDVLERIFDPFFTTKEQGKGTGLGLAMVYGIVKNHGGNIIVESEVGHGTTFTIYLPLSRSSAADETESETPIPHDRTGNILVVDDEDVVRNVAVQMLRRLGYKPHAVDNGLAAIEYFAEHKEEVDLVLIDMLMPEVSGQETFRRLKKLDPNVRAVLFSGYGLNEKAQEIIDEGLVGFLHKPFNLKELSEALLTAMKTQ